MKDYEIKKSHPRFGAIKFVIAARAKESSRYATQYIRVQENHIVATDGRRLHVAYMETCMVAGEYEVIKEMKSIVRLLSVDETVTFPEWKSILPKHYRYFDTADTSGDDKVTQRILGTLHRLNIALRPEYLDVLPDDARQWRVLYGRSESPVTLLSNYKKNVNLQAVFMPIELNFEAVKLRTRSYWVSQWAGL